MHGGLVVLQKKFSTSMKFEDWHDCCSRKMCLIWCLTLNVHPFLVVYSWVWIEEQTSKDMCWKEIWLCAQYLLILVDTIVNVSGGGGLYDHLITPRSSLWQWLGHSYKLRWFWEQWSWSQFGFANHLALSLIANFISYKK